MKPGVGRPCPKKSGEENRHAGHIGQEVDYGEFDSYDEESEFITPPKTNRKTLAHNFEGNNGTLLSLRQAKKQFSESDQIGRKSQIPVIWESSRLRK